MAHTRRQRRGRGGGSAGDLSFFSFQDIITSVTGILLLVTLVMAASIARDPPRASAAAMPEPAAFDVPTAEQTDALDRASAGRAAVQDRRAAERTAAAARLRRGADVVAMLAEGQTDVDGIRRLAGQIDALAAAAAPSLNAARADVARLDEAVAIARRQLDAADRDAVAAAAAARAEPELAFLPGAPRGRPVLIELGETTTRIGDLDPQGRPRLIAEADGPNDAAGAMDRAMAAIGGGDVSVVILAQPGGVGRVAEVAADVRRRGLKVGWDVAPRRSVFPERSTGGDDGATTRP